MDPNQQNMSGDSQSTGAFGHLTEDISALADSAKAKLGEVAEPMKEKALDIASQQKDAGADQLGIVARAVHGAACELESEMPQIAGYIHQAGQSLEQAADGLRDGSMDELMDKFGQFARNQPAIVFGGAMIAGFAMTRFLKSSAQNAQTGSPQRYAGTTQGGTA